MLVHNSKNTVWKKFLNISGEENMPINFIPYNIKMEIASENVLSDGSTMYNSYSSLPKELKVFYDATFCEFLFPCLAEVPLKISAAYIWYVIRK